MLAGEFLHEMSLPRFAISKHVSFPRVMLAVGFYLLLSIPNSLALVSCFCGTKCDVGLRKGQLHAFPKLGIAFNLIATGSS